MEIRTILNPETPGGRKKLVLTLLLAAVFLLLLLLLFSAWIQVGELREEFQRREEELARLQVEEMQLQVQEGEGGTDLGAVRPPSARERFRMQQELTALALDHGLTHFRLSMGQLVAPGAAPAAGETSDPREIVARRYAHAPLELSFESDYVSLGTFLYDLSQLEYPLSLDELRVSRRGGGLHSEMKARAYFEPTPADGASE